MKVIVGLGNPGKKYLDNRHNIGFRIIDRLAFEYQVRLRRSFVQKAWLGKLRVDSDLFLLVKPTTYMNNSGVCVAAVLAKQGISLDDLLVVYDDADLELGLIRARKNGSAAGHRGIASIIDFSGSSEINRLKVGIGRSGRGGLAGYVLSNFSQDEKVRLDRIIDEAKKVSLGWFKEKKEETIRVE